MLHFGFVVAVGSSVPHCRKHRSMQRSAAL